jgi:3-deoxy-manno-octulosonate cytidylyltransferase (CMP-KDO synthetase)
MIIGIIPARHASTRFPGKPLVKIGSKTMIQRVYEQTAKALENVYVATDHSEIYREVESFGGKVVMTSPNHRSGTDRCAETLELIMERERVEPEAVINIQGDEPFIEPAHIRLLADCFLSPSTQIATLVMPISSMEEVLNPNLPKVVLNKRNEAIYFSRSPIPYLRDIPEEEWIRKFRFLRHIGIYGYRPEVLLEITSMPPSSLELAESLEQNRWLENGYRVMTAEASQAGFSIDTPEDLKKIPPEWLED